LKTLAHFIGGYLLAVGLAEVIGKTGSAPSFILSIGSLPSVGSVVSPTNAAYVDLAAGGAVLWLAMKVL
jgi:hypothetical protein